MFVMMNRRQFGLLAVGMFGPEQRRVLYRLPDDAIPPEELAVIDQIVEVDVEAYLRWLETGEGPDPSEKLGRSVKSS